jgi:hypothetical protein
VYVVDEGDERMKNTQLDQVEVVAVVVVGGGCNPNALP